MKYYITINENNEIAGGYIQNIHKEIPKNAIEVSESIWKQRLNDSSLNCYENGKLVNKDFKTEEELETIRIDTINNKARAIIYGKYPQEKQSSAQLGIYGDEYLATMKTFIKQVIDISNKAIDDKIPAKDVDWAGLDK